MIKAMLLLFAPGVAWERILLTQRGLGRILMVYLLPLLVLVSLGEGAGLVYWGKWRGIVARPHTFPLRDVFILEVLQIFLSLLVVAINAKMIKSFGDTFHGRHSYTQTFTLSVYSLTPLFLLRLLNAFPHISPLAAWAVGVFLCMRVLYPGVPRVMDPDPPHTFGLFLMSAVLMVLTTGMVQFVVAWYLQGRFPALEAAISGWGARLPF
jgi:hypothetical protein